MKRVMRVVRRVPRSVPRAAQEKKEVFAFFDSPGGGWSEKGGTTFDTGYGVALRYFATPNLSAELSVAQRSVTIDAIRSRTNPNDLIAAYPSPNDSHWTPYLGLRLH